MELGSGGMGVVYKARHAVSGELVALKTLQSMTHPGLRRFKQEFRVVAGLAHPNLVTLRELFSDGATCSFTMELLGGVNLLDHVRDVSAGDSEHPADSLPRLRAAFAQLAAGLAALHAAGVLHRDVKPANTLVTPDGRAVLLDFGLAGELDVGGLYQSSPGQLAGTVAYMAPEQAAGDPLTHAADSYVLRGHPLPGPHRPGSLRG